MLVFVLALASCGGSRDSGFHGYLVFAQGAYLVRFSLRDGSLSVVTNLGDKRILDISAFGPEKLLVSETASISQKSVTRITWVDLETGRSEALYSGVRARFLPASGVIVYDDGGELYSVLLTGGSGVDKTVLSHGLHDVTVLVRAYPGVVLFELNDDGNRIIQAYNAENGGLEILEGLTAICRLDGAVWIDDLDKLACKSQSSPGDPWQYVLTNIDGKTVKPLKLPDEGRFRALTYVAEQGVLILNEIRKGPLGGKDKFAVWAYKLQDGEMSLLSKNQNLGASVVYTRL